MKQKNKKKRDWHKLEVFVDKAIPYLLILLLVLIILEIFYHHLIEHYLLWVDIADHVIIGFFVVDLVFKWKKSRNLKYFLKTSWLDILAVFPFYLIFRLFEEILILGRFGETFGTGQKILHEGLEVEKEVSKVAAEVEKSGKVSRTKMFVRFVKPIQRIPRFLKAFSFFEKPVRKKYKQKRSKQ
ncbi:MAG: ion transporter [Nanoarchaeota archaeon]|nr:ion transporter [Nanoarchaeota archaeon]